MNPTPTYSVDGAIDRREPSRPLGRITPVRMIGGRSARLQHALLRGLHRMSKPASGRGFMRGSWILGRLFDRNNAVVADLGEGARLEIPLWDGYWMWTALGEPYEPEIELVLDRVLSPEVSFIDGGANIGYWAARMAGRTRITVAVEASPLTYARLERTAKANGDSFVVVHRALWDSDSGAVRVVLHPMRHAAASAVDLEDQAYAPGYTTVRIPTVSLETLYDMYAESGPAVVKLDVEGAEQTVLESSRELFRRAPMLCLYEDHGRDLESRATASLLEAGLSTWLLTAQGTTPIRSPEQLRNHKVKSNWGYNLAAAHPDTGFAEQLDEMATARQLRDRPSRPRPAPVLADAALADPALADQGARGS